MKKNGLICLPILPILPDRYSLTPKNKDLWRFFQREIRSYDDFADRRISTYVDFSWADFPPAQNGFSVCQVCGIRGKMFFVTSGLSGILLNVGRFLWSWIFCTIRWQVCFWCRPPGWWFLFEFLLTLLKRCAGGICRLPFFGLLGKFPYMSARLCHRSASAKV